MDLMRETPDNHFDLAIVDPPYGIKGGTRKSGGASNKNGFDRWKDHMKSSQWDDKPPPSEYFDELRRVSKNQIVWGGNYFDLPPTRGILIWDKVQPMPTMSFGELAWTSYDKPMKKIEYAYTNYVEGKGQVSKNIHPTQKPRGLYDRILHEYAEQGQRILDTHMGSGSIAIACHYFGAHLTATEIDEDYFNDACERIERETRQMDLFQANNLR